jgi:nitric oxide reductase NorE protein
MDSMNSTLKPLASTSPASSPDSPGPSPDEDWGILSQLPGNPMMWLLIWSELAVFGAAFIGFSVARLLDPETFLHSQETLNRLLGAINTMVLITSGYFAALAVNAQSRGKSAHARLWLLAAGLLGAVFLAVKVKEYGEKFAHGVGIETNNFYMLYFLLTGFHAMHVVLGMVILAVVAWKNSLENFETGAAFWHMVDLIWVTLFPLIYLMR